MCILWLKKPPGKTNLKKVSETKSDPRLCSLFGERSQAEDYRGIAKSRLLVSQIQQMLSAAAL